MPLSWSDPQPLHNGPDRDTDAWGYWLQAQPGAADGLDAPGLHPSSSPAPDRPGAADAGGWADWEAGQGGHGSPGDWRTPTSFASMERRPDPAAWLQLLHPEPGAVTLLHGDGSAGKGTLGAWLVAQASLEGLVMVLDAEGHPQEWRRRLEGLGADLERCYWVGHRGGRIEPQDYAAAGFGLVVVDSAAYFTPQGADPWGPDAATALQEAARASGVPWLVLAHHAKGSDSRKAYGSVYWHNVPRVSLGLVDDAGDRTLACHKATDVEGLTKGQAWRVDVEYEGITPVSLQLVPLGQLARTPKQVGQELLRQGWLSTQQLALRAGGSASSWRSWVVELGCQQRTVPTGTGGADKVEYSLA